jgi:hypothetical protein
MVMIPGWRSCRGGFPVLSQTRHFVANPASLFTCIHRGIFAGVLYNQLFLLDFQDSILGGMFIAEQRCPFFAACVAASVLA